MSDTPKVSAEIQREYMEGSSGAYLSADFARTLERELTAKDALILTLKNEIQAACDDEIPPDVRKRLLLVISTIAPNTSIELAGKRTDEPNANGSVYARLNWWKVICDEISQQMSELLNDKKRLDSGTIRLPVYDEQLGRTICTFTKVDLRSAIDSAVTSKDSNYVRDAIDAAMKATQ